MNAQSILHEAIKIGQGYSGISIEPSHFYMLYDILTGSRCATCAARINALHNTPFFPLLRLCDPCHDREQEVRSYE